MKKFLLSIFALASASFANAQCTDLFFSEYCPATGNNKYLEIYNPTASAISLTGYSIKRFRGSSGVASPRDASGGGWSEKLALSGSIPAYGTWVCVNGQTADLTTPTVSPKCDPALQALANQLGSGIYNISGGGEPFYFNGDDVMTLEKNDVLVDIFGKLGEAPTTAWSTDAPHTGATGMGKWITHDYQMIRKASVKSGVSTNPSVFNPMAEWDTIPKTPRNNWTKLGAHTCDCNPNGIAKINSNDDLLVAYPNPSNSNLTIDAGKLISNVKVYNLIGEALMLTETSNTSKVTFQTDKLSQGVYIIVVNYIDKTSSSTRFIKE